MPMTVLVALTKITMIMMGDDVDYDDDTDTDSEYNCVENQDIRL